MHAKNGWNQSDPTDKKIAEAPSGAQNNMGGNTLEQMYVSSHMILMDIWLPIEKARSWSGLSQQMKNRSFYKVNAF